MSEHYQELKDLWKPWYEAQLKEIHNHKKRYLEEKPTLYPAEHFNPEDDTDALRKAMKGLGTNEDLLIDILTKRSLDQRLKIQDVYGLRHSRDLTHDLKKELNGKFERVILALMKPLPLFYAEQIQQAAKGPGTDETALIEIFCTRDDDFIKTVKETFENHSGTTLESVISKETSGGFQKLLIAILALCRDDSTASPDDVADELCAEDVDEDRIIRIVTSYTLYFLHRVFKKYHDKSGQDFPDLVGKVCSREARAAYKAIFLSSKSKAEFFAYALNEALEGTGTDDTTLIRIVVSRCEIDLGSIKKKYHKLTDKDLDHRVKKDVSGDYQRALLNLIGCFD